MPERQPALAAALRPPLAAVPGAGLRLAEVPFTAKLILRGDAGDAAFRAGAEEALGCPLPAAGGSCAGSAGAVLWLGPGEWLATGPPDAEERMAEALGRALSGHRAAIVDVTDGRVQLRLSGPRVREVLAKGCPLDLHPSAFGPGRVAASLLAQADILLHCLGTEGEAPADPVFDLYVARSFAPYVRAWLVDAGHEFRVGAG